MDEIATKETVMKGINYLLGLGILMTLFSFFLVGIKTARTESYNQTAPNIVTGGGVTTTAVTLLKPLFNDDITSVTGISTNLTDPLENPAVSSYVPSTKVLTIQGLKASDTRTLVITYIWGNLDVVSDTFMQNMTIFFIVGALILTTIGLWQQYGGKH